MSRVELFAGATPDLAASVRFNTALLCEVGQGHSAEEKATVIDNAIVQAAADLEKQLEVAHAEAEAEAANAADRAGSRRSVAGRNSSRTGGADSVRRATRT